MSPFQAWWIDGRAVDQVLGRVRRDPARELLLVEQRLLRDLELVRVGGVEVPAVDQVRLADRLLEVVEDEHPARAVGVGEVVPGAGHPADDVVPPGDPGRVVGVGDRELALGIPPAGVVEGRDAVGVVEAVAVEAVQQALLVEPVGVLGRRPDHVVAAAGPELGDHRLEVVEVDLVDLDPVLLAEPLLDVRVHVLGPVEDQEVAVDLGLDRRGALGLVDRALDGAAGQRAEPVEAERAAGAGAEQLAAVQPRVEAGHALTASASRPGAGSRRRAASACSTTIDSIAAGVSAGSRERHLDAEAVHQRARSTAPPSRGRRRVELAARRARRRSISASRARQPSSRRSRSRAASGSCSERAQSSIQRSIRGLGDRRLDQERAASRRRPSGPSSRSPTALGEVLLVGDQGRGQQLLAGLEPVEDGGRAGARALGDVGDPRVRRARAR